MASWVHRLLAMLGALSASGGSNGGVTQQGNHILRLRLMKFGRKLGAKLRGMMVTDIDSTICEW